MQLPPLRRRSSYRAFAQVPLDGTRERYVEAYERITGEPFSAWLDRTAPGDAAQ